MTRAAKGGERGANGEWYKGGQFLNTVAENPKREGSNNRKPSGKQEIAPYEWAVAPEGKRSLYRRIAGIFGRVENGVAVLRNDSGLQATLDYCGVSLEQAKSLIDRWNAGERWI